jgi:hypothetical protein
MSHGALLPDIGNACGKPVDKSAATLMLLLFWKYCRGDSQSYKQHTQAHKVL